MQIITISGVHFTQGDLAANAKRILESLVSGCYDISREQYQLVVAALASNITQEQQKVIVAAALPTSTATEDLQGYQEIANEAALGYDTQADVEQVVAALR